MVSPKVAETVLGISSSISIFCSFIIIFTFACQKEIRTVTRHIIICISLADFCTALAYLTSLTFTFKTFTVTTSRICVLQSFVSSTSSLCSFLWTMSFSLALFLILVKEKVTLLQKMLPFLHVFCWLVPLIINITALSLHKLGKGNSTGSWCWIGKLHKMFCFLCLGNGTSESLCNKR